MRCRSRKSGRAACGGRRRTRCCRSPSRCRGHRLRCFAIDFAERQAPVEDQVDKVEALEVALVIRVGVLDELTRQMDGRERAELDQQRTVAINANTGREERVGVGRVRPPDAAQHRAGHRRRVAPHALRRLACQRRMMRKVADADRR